MAGIASPSDAGFKRMAGRLLVVIVLATAFAAHAARSVRLFHPAGSLLSDQPLLTDDNSMHSYYTQLGAKLIRGTGEPYGYVPDEMAGHPKTAIYDAGILPVEQLMARVTFLSPFVVYKLFVLVAMLAVAVCGLLALLLFRVRGLALCVGWFLLMFHYWWGQGLIFTMGGMNTWLLAASGALLLTGAIARLIESWSPPLAVLVAILFCLLPYLHPIAIVPVGLSALVLIACSKDRQRTLLFVVCCGALSVLINWHWISNTMQNRAIATPLAEMAGAAEGPVRLLRETTNEIHGAVGLSKLVNRVNVAAFNVAVVVGGLGGLVWLRRKKDPRCVLLLVFVVVLGGLTYFSGGISALQNLQPWRLRYLFLLVCSVAIALTLPDLLAAKGAKRYLALLIGLFAAFYFFAFDARRDVPPLQVGLTPAQQSWVVAINSTTDGRGRILAEDGPGYDGIGLAALHLGTHAQWIGGPYRGAYIVYHRVNFIDGVLSGRDLGSYSPQELSDFFRRYNVHWIFAWSKPSKEALSGKPQLLRSEWEKDGHVLYSVINPADSYFEKGSGELTADLDSLKIKNAVSSGGSIVLRYHFYNGLVADGASGLKSFSVPRDPVGFIEVVGPGKDVTIHVRH